MGELLEVTIERRYHSPQMTLPCLRNSENVEMTALSSSVARCSFFTRNPSLRLLGSGGAISSRRHQTPIILFPELACLLHFLRQDLVDEGLIRQSLLLSGFTQPTQDFRI